MATLLFSLALLGYIHTVLNSRIHVIWPMLVPHFMDNTCFYTYSYTFFYFPTWPHCRTSQYGHTVCLQIRTHATHLQFYVSPYIMYSKHFLTLHTYTLACIPCHTTGYTYLPLDMFTLSGYTSCTSASPLWPRQVTPTHLTSPHLLVSSTFKLSCPESRCVPISFHNLWCGSKVQSINPVKDQFLQYLVYLIGLWDMGSDGSLMEP